MMINTVSRSASWALNKSVMMLIPKKILFSVSVLILAGIILVLFGTVTLFGIFGISSGSTEYTVVSAMISFALLAGMGIFDLLAAYFIIKRSRYGKKLGVIVAFLGCLPGQSFLINMPFVIFFSSFISNSHILFAPQFIWMFLFFGIMIILLRDKTYFLTKNYDRS